MSQTLLDIDSKALEKNTYYHRKVTFRSKIRMLGRPFPQCAVVESTLDVMYPIRIEAANCQPWLGPGEYTSVEIILRNVSTRDYGFRLGAKSAGEVTLHLWSSELVEFSPQRRRLVQFRVPLVPAKQCVSYKFNVKMHPFAATKLFDREEWGLGLVLRDKLIESHTYTIRVTPTFVPAKRADLVMLTSAKMQRTNFVAWNQAVTELGLSVNLWDLERYGGVHDKNAKLTWIGTASHLVFPVFRDANLLKQLGTNPDSATVLVGCDPLFSGFDCRQTLLRRRRICEAFLRSSSFSNRTISSELTHGMGFCSLEWPRTPIWTPCCKKNTNVFKTSDFQTCLLSLRCQTSQSPPSTTKVFVE